jgi:hypothetical protein
MEAIRLLSSWASRGPRLRYRGAADDASPALPPAFCSRRNLGRRVLSPATRFVRRHRPPHLVGENASERCEHRPRALAQTRRLNHRPPAWLAQNVTTSTASFQDARSSGSGSSRFGSNPSGILRSGPRCGGRCHSVHRMPTAYRGHGVCERDRVHGLLVGLRTARQPLLPSHPHRLKRARLRACLKRGYKRASSNFGLCLPGGATRRI